MQFRWAARAPLRPGMSYEVVVWSSTHDPDQAWGVAPPTAGLSRWLDLNELMQGGQFGDDRLYWTVLVVEVEPYRRQTLPSESEQRFLVFALNE